MKHFRADILSPLSITAAVLLSLGLGASSALAYTEQEAQSACAPDVMRMCQEFVPDHGRIAACLRHHHRDLSAACRSVMASGGGSARHRQRHAER
jgi:hypothetical protein